MKKHKLKYGEYRCKYCGYIGKNKNLGEISYIDEEGEKMFIKCLCSNCKKEL